MRLAALILLIWLCSRSELQEVPVSSEDWYNGFTTTPEDVAMREVLSKIGANADEYIEVFLTELLENFAGDDDRRETIDMVRRQIQPMMPVKAVSCSVCLATITLLQSLMQAGLQYEDVRNATLEICRMVVEPDGYNPDMLCEPILDTYGPHVAYILNTTDKNAPYICDLHNVCGNPRRTSKQPVRLSASQSPPNRRNVPTAATSGGTLRSLRKDELNAPIRLVHLSDIHADANYSEGSPTNCDMPLCCREDYNGTGVAAFWGDYECNGPYRTIEKIFIAVAEQMPDIIVYTGDTVQHTVWDQPQSQTLDASRWLTELFAQYFPGIPVYYAIGNHDTSPTNLYYFNRSEIQELNQVTFQHWSPLSRFGPEQQATYERGSYYAIENHPGLRVLGYNSNYCTLDNFYAVLNDAEEEYPVMKAFMEDTLAMARANNEKVLLVGHHPTGGRGYITEYGEFITDIHARYGDIVALHLLGHSHGDSFALVRDFESGATQGVQISGPAATGYTDINPSFRVIYLDPVTFDPLDWDNYHLNLAVDRDNPDAEIKLIYRASEEYKMADLTPASFDDLINRMELNRTLMEQYIYNSGTRVYDLSSCDDECAGHTLCDLRHTDYPRSDECHAAVPPANATATI